MTLAKTMTMKEDVLSDHLEAVALMVLVLLAPTTRGLSALMEPDPTTANARIPAHRLAPMEQLPFVWTAVPQLQGQSVQTSTLTWSFSGLKKGGNSNPTTYHGTTGDLFNIVLAENWKFHQNETLT